MLRLCPMMGFVPTGDRARARAFFVDLLGLAPVSEDPFALVVSANGTHIRIVDMVEFTPVPYTILGWQVPDISAVVAELTHRGIVFQRLPHFTQDDAGIWTAPGGTRIAWFHDPDGNTLSLSQHL